MRTGLKAGLDYEIVKVVSRDLCVRGLRGVPPVLATAELVRLMEMAAHFVLEPFCDENESSVGTQVDVRHTAATPMGMRVRAVARLVAVEGRRCRFEVEAFDETERIGHGTHERFVIDASRFRQRMDKKLSG